jgi:hypothetical protein
MTFRADGTSVVDVSDDGATSGVALAFHPDMARQIAEALNKHLPGRGGRAKVDPLTGKTVEQLDINDGRPLSDVIGKGKAVRIVGPYATAMMGTPDGRQVRALNEGALLPNDVTAGHARHLIDVGLAEVIDAAPARRASRGAPTQTPEGAQTPDSDQPNEPGDRPVKADPKPAWVEYAVSQRPEGQSEEDARAEAEAKSKADLVTQYGG